MDARSRHRVDSQCRKLVKPLPPLFHPRQVPRNARAPWFATSRPFLKTMPFHLPILCLFYIVLRILSIASALFEAPSTIESIKVS